MEKNYFAALDYRLDLVVAGTAFVLLVSASLIAGAFFTMPAGRPVLPNG